MSALLIALLVFLVVALATFAVISLIDERRAQARLIKDRLATVQKAPEREPDEELALLRDELLSKIPALDTLLRRSARVSAMQKLLVQAGMKFRAGNFLMLCVVSAFPPIAVFVVGKNPVRLGRPDHRLVPSLRVCLLPPPEALSEI